MKKDILKKSLWERIFQNAIDVAVYLVLRPKVEWEKPSVQNELENRPLIFICNHTNHLDGTFVSAVLHAYHPYTLVTNKWYQKKQIGKLLQWSRCIPIDLTEIDANWYRISEKCMLSGGTILIFPEGDIAREGKMLSFQPGAGLLSAKTGAAIVPVASYGDYHLLFGKRQILRIGVPIESDCPSNVRHSVYAKQLIHQAEVKVKQLYGTLEQEHGRIGTYPNESYAPAAKSI